MKAPDAAAPAQTPFPWWPTASSISPVRINSCGATVFLLRPQVEVHDLSGSCPLFLFFVELGFHRVLDFLVESGIVLKRFLRRVATLGQLRSFVIKPRTAFLDDLFLQGEIEERAHGRNAFVIRDIELSFGKRGRAF